MGDVFLALLIAIHQDDGEAVKQKGRVGAGLAAIMIVKSLRDALDEALLELTIRADRTAALIQAEQHIDHLNSCIDELQRGA